MPLDIRPVEPHRRKTKPAQGQSLGFGKIYSDHMHRAVWRAGQGWGTGEIAAFRDIDMSPAALVLHYGQTIFEGLKAYRSASGGVNLFRPDMNRERFARSAARLDLPEPPPYEDFIEAIRELIRLDHQWIPHGEGESLYIRPAMIAVEPYIGLKSSSEVLLFIIAGPVGAYYRQGFAPTRIRISEHFSRAARLGLGAAKTAANYAAGLLASRLALEDGYDQVLWLDAAESRYLEEVGSMNIFFKIDGVVHTPTLETGTVLAGVTRASALELMRDWGVETVERRIDIDELIAASEQGRLEEIFGAGTAAAINPVSCFSYKGRDYDLPAPTQTSLTQRLFETLTAIQYGRSDLHPEWIVNFDV